MLDLTTPEWDEEFLRMMEEGIYLLPEPPNAKF